jgi:SAM-dependent methyltransferase
MMFGTRDEFGYWECSTCGCLQIVEIPSNLGSYYPDNYYSFSSNVVPRSLWMYRAYYRAFGLAKLIRRPGEAFQSVIDARLRKGARILDVGCGSGKFVKILRSIGFDAHGIDPFIKAEGEYVRRARIEDTTEKNWDLIMFHHSLEHMSSHIDVLRAARDRLAVEGTCLVRIPIANWAWLHYKQNWVQLDPPRHLIIHTLSSFKMAAELAGFRISQITFDSGPFQFYGSELYERNIPLIREDSDKDYPDKSAMKQFKARSSELNRQQLGDQACFYLK